MRVKAIQEVKGYNPTLIGGEEPEMCVRLRQQGWKIYRIDADMTIHDAAIFHFSQWWKRSIRGGWAMAEGAAMHGHLPERYQVKESRSRWFWGLLLPIAALGLAGFTHGLSLLAFLLYPVLMWKIYRYRLGLGDTAAEARLYAVFCVVAKLPEAIGQVNYWLNRWQGKQATLIEYKQPSPVKDSVLLTLAQLKLAQRIRSLLLTMKLLITGASGFLGQYVVAEALRQGHQVKALMRSPIKLSWSDHPAVEIVQADLQAQSSDRLTEAVRGVDAVIHLAAVLRGDYATQYAGTVTATENLLNAMTQAGVDRLIAISSFSVFDYSSIAAGEIIQRRLRDRNQSQPARRLHPNKAHPGAAS